MRPFAWPLKGSLSLRTKAHRLYPAHKAILFGLQERFKVLSSQSCKIRCLCHNSDFWDIVKKSEDLVRLTHIPIW